MCAPVSQSTYFPSFLPISVLACPLPVLLSASVIQSALLPSISPFPVPRVRSQRLPVCPDPFRLLLLFCSPFLLFIPYSSLSVLVRFLPSPSSPLSLLYFPCCSCPFLNPPCPFQSISYSPPFLFCLILLYPLVSLTPLLFLLLSSPSLFPSCSPLFYLPLLSCLPPFSIPPFSLPLPSPLPPSSPPL